MIPHAPLVAIVGMAAIAAAQARAAVVVPLEGRNAVMCRDPKSLADLTAPDGQVRALPPFDRGPLTAELVNNCKDLPTGSRLTVVSRRHNTSIVTMDGQTWYLANIDVMTPGPACLGEGARISAAGRIEYGTAVSIRDETTRYRYIRLRLDTPLCWAGDDGASPAEHTISLPSSSDDASRQLKAMVGRHVTATGVVASPDNGNQPPDVMMMFDPVIGPAQ